MDAHRIMFNVDLGDLQGLVGQRVRCGERVYTIIDVLEEGPAIVMESESHYTVIRENQHGDPSRRGRDTLTLPVLSTDGRSLNPLLNDLATLISFQDRSAR